jgi:hypothetical protein
MKTLRIPQRFPSIGSEGSFAAARALAVSVAESDSDLLEPELVAWFDQASSHTSPVLEGCGGPDGWRDYGISHGGRLEVDVDGGDAFIFAETSQFDSYAHFGPGPFRILRDAKGNESLCRPGGVDCVPLNEWTSQLT